MRIPDVSHSSASDLHAERRAVPVTQRFRKRVPAARPAPEQLRRQDALLKCAWSTLRESAPVIAFLNSHNEQLGGQPLHLALESDEGLRRVEARLRTIAIGTTRNGA